MTLHDPLVVRAAVLYAAIVPTLLAAAWRRPDARALGGAALAFVWNLPAVLLLDIAAARFGWWTFEARGGLLLGTPVDLWLAWACLWGALPALACPSLKLPFVALAALAIDVVLMPRGAPVIRLGSHWLAGEAAGLACALIPAQALARWTARSVQLERRAALQVLAFAGLLIVVLPAIVLDATAAESWRLALDRPAWLWSLIVQLLAIPGVLGLTAVQEFAGRGGGTPVPFDPPRRLVASGAYAYVRNPMQLSAVVLLMLLGIALRSYWIAAGALVAHAYAAGFAWWDEDADLRRRYGLRWTAYRAGVRAWIPTWRPWHEPGTPPARLFVAESCGMCRDVGSWFRARRAAHLMVLPAESHPSRSLRRITYEPGDGGPAATGVAALARALEHVHFGWAFAGFVVRLPLLKQTVQLLADASGGAPRGGPGGSGKSGASGRSARSPLRPLRPA